MRYQSLDVLGVADQLASIVAGAITVATALGAAMAVRRRKRRRMGRKSALIRLLGVVIAFCVGVAVAAGALRLVTVSPIWLDTTLALVSLAAALTAGATFVWLLRARATQRPALAELLMRWLEKQRFEAQRHRYSFGRVPPTVGELYVSRTAARTAESNSGVLTVPQLLTDWRYAVILADPGGGKSMLASWLAGQSATYWLGEKLADSELNAVLAKNVVTYLPAQLLVGTDLATAIAAYWSRPDLTITREVLSERPARRVEWLVVVDGLDEITEADVRSGVIRYLSQEIAGARQGRAPYRIIVTSRPLFSGETKPLRDAGAGVFRLRPFGPDQLRDFAVKWFTERGRPGSNPKTEAERFLTRVEQARLAAMVEVPLLAAMAATIYELAPEVGLPDNRTGLYRDFVLLLQSKSTQSTLHPPFRSWLLDGTGDRPELLWALADAYISSPTTDLLRVATTWVLTNDRDSQLTSLPSPVWANSLHSALVSCSLLTERRGNFEFLHLSLAEYIAADSRRATFDQDRCLRELTSPATRSLGLFRLGRSDVAPQNIVSQLVDRDPLAAGHVLADGGEVSSDLRAQVVDGLIRVAVSETPTASEGLAVLVRMTTESATWQQVVERLVRSRNAPGWVRVVTADELAELDAMGGTSLLRELAEDPELDEASAREWAASRLSARGDEAGQRIYIRLRAADRPLTADVLSDMNALQRQAYWDTARDPRQPPSMRVRAAMTLAILTGLADPETLHILRLLLPGDELTTTERTWAAHALALKGDAMAKELLASPAAPVDDVPPEQQSPAQRCHGADPLGRPPVDGFRFPPVGRYATALSRYRRTIAERLRFVVVPAVESPRRIDLLSVYVPLKPAEQSVEDAPLEDLYAEARKHRRVVILGAPGSGKTTLLRSSMLQWALSPGRRGRGVVVPVLIDLARFSAERELEEEIADELHRNGMADSERITRRLLDSGAFVGLFDGLDQVAGTRRQQLEHQLRTFATRYPECQLVVTCRSESYRHQLSPQFEHLVRIAEFDDVQIRRFIAYWPFSPEAEVMDRLFATPGFTRLARNPLVLTMVMSLLAVQENMDPIPSRSSLYDNVVRHLLRSAWTRGSTRYKESIKHVVLSRLAVAMQDVVSKTEGLTRQQVQAHVSALLPRFNLGPEHLPPIVEEVLTSGLLVALGHDGPYQFVYLTIREYFAAHELQYDPIALIEHFTADPQAWRETVKLWCGTTFADITPVISHLITDNPALAFECVAEAQQVPSDLVPTMLRRLLDLPQADNRPDLDGLGAALALPSAAIRHGARQLHEDLVSITETPGDPRRPIAYVVLAAQQNAEAAHVLMNCAREDPRALDALASMRDNGIAALGQLAAEGSVEAVDEIADLATSDSTDHLVSLLNGPGHVARRAAVRLTIILLSQPAAVDRAHKPVTVPETWSFDDPRVQHIVTQIGELLRPDAHCARDPSARQG